MRKKYLKKTIEYGLYLLVFLLPIQARWIIKAGEINGGYWEYGTYSLYASDILLMALLVLFIIYDFFSISGGKKNYKFIGCLLLFSAVSILFADNRTLAMYKFSWMALGAGLFWVIAKAEYGRAKFFLSLFSGLALQAVLGIWQFLNQSSPANKWLGMAPHQAVDLGASVVETIGADGAGERWLRACGGLDHPNMLGGIMAIGILLLCWKWISCASWRRGLVIIFPAALFFSFSRSAWLALIVGLAVFFSRAVFKKNLIAQKNTLQIILISGTVFFILFLQYKNLVIARFGAGERLEIKSISEREESIKNSLPIIKNNLIAGTGLGNYGLALKNLKPDKESFYYQPAHNVFLLVLSEIGIFGFIFFMALMFFAFGGAENFAVLTALIAIMFFDHWLWSLHFGVLFFWMVLGVIEKRKEMDCGSSLPVR